MAQRIRLLHSLLLLGALACSAPPAGIDPALKSLQGNWDYVSFHEKGSPVPAEKLKKLHVVVANDRWQIHNADTLVEELILQVDSSKAPPHLAWVSLGDNMGKTELGIYELTDKELKICAAPAGKPRPSEFTSHEKNGASLIVLRRRD